MNTTYQKDSLRRIFTSLLLSVCLLAIALWFAGQLVAALAVVFLSHMWILYATLNPSSQWLGPVVTRFDSDGRQVWLTIDDGPDPEETPVVLDLLDEYQAKATFFLIGKQAKAQPDIVRQILERGHSIGNHTMNHLQEWFWGLSRKRIESEVSEGSAIIREITGESPQWFRAPVGHKPWPLHPVLQKPNLPLVGWTARGFDGVSTDSDRVVRRIEKNLAPGAIILLHEGRGTLPATLEKLLPRLSKQGYHCVLPPSDSYICGRRKTIR